MGKHTIDTLIVPEGMTWEGTDSHPYLQLLLTMDPEGPSIVIYDGDDGTMELAIMITYDEPSWYGRKVIASTVAMEVDAARKLWNATRWDSVNQRG
tara:strand:- start:145 stop:432 length:288 start_codon:yes stop_codon:yes gene_type:complete